MRMYSRDMNTIRIGIESEEKRNCNRKLFKWSIIIWTITKGNFFSLSKSMAEICSSALEWIIWYNATSTKKNDNHNKTYVWNFWFLKKWWFSSLSMVFSLYPFSLHFVYEIKFYSEWKLGATAIEIAMSMCSVSVFNLKTFYLHISSSCQTSAWVCAECALQFKPNQWYEMKTSVLE